MSSTSATCISGLLEGVEWTETILGDSDCIGEDGVCAVVGMVAWSLALEVVW